MNTESVTESANTEVAPRFWSEEPSNRAGRRRIRARIGGLHCSLCTGTIERALEKQPGVDKVAVSLTHEQALIEYDPSRTRAEDLLQTLKDIGYTVSDPRKLRPFEEEERALVRERGRFLVALAMSIAAMGLAGYPVTSPWFALCVFSIASLVAFSFVVLRGQGLGWAIAGSAALAAMGAGVYAPQLGGVLGGATPWLAGGLAVVLIFGVGLHILHMAVAALRRGILNQHVLVEFGAFAGLAGGSIGLAFHPPDYPTTARRERGARVDELEARGLTVIAVAREGSLVGLLALGDALRPDAVDAVRRLHDLGIHTSLVTGDNEQAARHFARAAGIEAVHARVLPAEKATLIRRLQESSRVAMVGDGINDAPALMQADVGIAFGSGADIAIESADVIILNRRLGAVLDAWETSRHSYRKIVQNVVLAFTFNGIGIPAAATGLVYPIWGMVAMAASVTAIFINSLWSRGAYFFDAIQTVGRAQPIAPEIETGSEPALQQAC